VDISVILERGSCADSRVWQNRLGIAFILRDSGAFTFLMSEFLRVVRSSGLPDSTKNVHPGIQKVYTGTDVLLKQISHTDL
jgi:hypothetical protein